jgi:hypothetical protein
MPLVSGNVYPFTLIYLSKLLTFIFTEANKRAVDIHTNMFGKLILVIF